MQNAKFRELSILGIAADGDTSVAIAAAASSLFEEILSMSKTQRRSGDGQATKPDAASANVQPVNIRGRLLPKLDKPLVSRFSTKAKHLAELKKVAAGNDELLVAAIEAGWSRRNWLAKSNSCRPSVSSSRSAQPTLGRFGRDPCERCRRQH